jgi:predicted transposase/invertase (TIGR01784 family)
MKEFLDPKNDLTFRRLFGNEKNKGILLAFLNDVFDGVHPKIEDVSFQRLNQYPEIRALAEGIVDLACRDSEGNQIIIEMQCYGDSEFIQRACFYSSCVYVSQKTQENKYDDLKPVRFLAILEGSLFPNNPAYLSHDKLLNVVTHECRIQQFSYSFLELGKINKSLEESKTMIEKWAYFFKHATKTTDEELKALARDYPPVWEAYRALERYNYTKEELDEYLRFDRSASAIATSISDAEKKGESKKAREIVFEMHREGLDKQVIAKVTHLSLEEVEQVLAEGEESAKA